MFTGIKKHIPESISDKLRFIGPGLLLAIAAAGESGISEALEIGAHYHFDLIWVIVLTLLFKFAFTNGIARYSLSTGETIFEGLKKIPGPKNWTVVFVTVIFLLEMFAFGGMLLFGAIFLDYYLPGVYFERILALLTLAVILFLLWKDSYERVEIVVIAIAVCLFAGIGYCLLEFNLPFESIIFGLIPAVPEGSVLSVMALMGAVGSGLNLLLYSVWLCEKSGGEHGPEFFKRYIGSVNCDLVIAFFLVSVVTVLFLTLGVSGFVVSFIGHGETLSIDTIIVEVLYVLSNIPFGDSFFLIFGYLIMFGATVTGMDGRARAISSVIKSSSEIKLSEIQLYRILLIVFAVIISAGIFVGEPAFLIHLVAAVAAIMFALLGFMIVYLDLRLPDYSRGSRLWLLVMILGSSVFLLMALIMEGSFISIGLPLIERLVLLIIPVYIFMRTDLFRKCLTKSLDLSDLLWVIMIFGAISVYGTFRGIPVEDVVINAGHVGPVILGILCGPFAGAMAGLIGGLFIDTGGEMIALPFALGTVASGIIAGCFTKYWKNDVTYSKAAVIVIVAEITNFIILPLLFQVDFSYILDTIRKTFLPMIITNMTGVLIFVYFFKEGGHTLIKPYMKSPGKVNRNSADTKCSEDNRGDRR